MRTYLDARLQRKLEAAHLAVVEAEETTAERKWRRRRLIPTEDPQWVVDEVTGASGTNKLALGNVEGRRRQTRWRRRGRGTLVGAPVRGAKKTRTRGERRDKREKLEEKRKMYR